jgi:hypothetical protein
MSGRRIAAGDLVGRQGRGCGAINTLGGLTAWHRWWLLNQDVHAASTALCRRAIVTADMCFALTDEETIASTPWCGGLKTLKTLKKKYPNRP